jgi:hypothetical protein
MPKLTLRPLWVISVFDPTPTLDLLKRAQFYRRERQVLASAAQKLENAKKL